ncbi:MAG: c-type cytochrome [Pirellulales bacterium]|nr:c-type cytochrome [Pirellulales bacterium]
MSPSRIAAHAALCLFCGFSLLAGPAAVAQLSPEEELRTLAAARGMEVSLYASEPLITNPAAIDIDTHGRVWVAEIQWYRAAAKNPPADKIKVLEDTDGDGRADRVTVFADGVFAPMSICVAGEQVYVATSPDLWVYEDRDGDLRADGPPRRLLTGFGGYNHDHGAHSLVLGPDHKWWMAHGDAGFDVTGTDGSRAAYRWGAMLRGELDGTQLETVAVNFRNPYELCVSSFGEAYCSDNDNDGNFSTRVCWILEGGNYGWYGGPPARVPAGTPFGEHWHFRGHIPGHVPATLVTGFGSPCGIAFYEGDAFGPHYKNAPWHADAGPREVRLYRHEPAGAGKRATSEVILTTVGDGYFRPDDVCVHPDGSVYISDWYDGGVGGHAYNNPDQGRIFVLRPAGKRLQPVAPPGPYHTIDEALAGLKSPNLATQYLARERLLAEGQDSVPALVRLLDDTEPNYRARALWVLDRIGGAAREHVVRQLQNEDAAFRALAVRILRRHGGEFARQILAMARDPAPEVLREVLLALPHIEGEQPLAILTELATSFDGGDRYLLETINIAAAGRKPMLVAALLQRGLTSLGAIQLLQALDPQAAAELLTRSLTAASVDDAVRASLLALLGGTPSPEAGETVLRLAADAKAPAELRRLALHLLAVNLGGPWQELRNSSQLAAMLPPLLADAELRQPALALIRQQGLDALGGSVLALVRNPEIPDAERIEAVETLAALRGQPADGAEEALLDLVRTGGSAVRTASLAALVDLQLWRAVQPLLAGGLAEAERTTLLERMMAASGGALVVLRWLDRGELPADLREPAIALAETHPDANVRVLFERFIPPQRRPRRLGEAVKPEELLAMPADPRRGEQIFFHSSAAQCKNCHAVHGMGGSVGPDLSQIGRKYERAALLETILDPSRAMAPEYIPYLLQTTDGRVYAGFIVENTDDHVLLKDVQGNLVRVRTDEIDALEKQQKSLMPELVLRDVTAQDAADLLAYLESLNQAVQPVSRLRVLGPFASPDGQGIERDFGPESQAAAPDLQREYPGAPDRTCRWELWETRPGASGAVFDQVQRCQARGLPAEGVTHYCLLYLDSVAEQPATLLVGTDDSGKIWLNGEVVYTYVGNRAVTPAEDRVEVRLRQGRNVLLIKVENHQGPGGLSLSIGSGGAVRLATE